MAKTIWHPRHGARLEEVPEESSFYQRVLAVLGKIRRIFPHPVWGLMVATFLAFAGRGELQLRSYGLLLVALWLIVDLWEWILRRGTPWKFVMGCTTTSLLLIGIMLIMWLGLNGKMTDQQEDVAHNLHMDASLGTSTFSSMVTLQNQSSADIEIVSVACLWVRVLFTNGLTFDKSAISIPFQAQELKSGGEGASFVCPPVAETNPALHQVACADLNITTNYVLKTQPLLEQQKSFRFVTFRSIHGEGPYTWHQEPVEVAGDGTFCSLPGQK